MQIIPAIDIIDGKCVRLTQGDYNAMKVYNEDPLEVARMFEDAGFKRVHLVDLDGARAGAVKNWRVLEVLSANTQLEIDFGGGIKTANDVEIVLQSGARWATVGSVAVKNENAFVAWLQQYTPEKFLLGADVKEEKIAVAGWLETTDIGIVDFIEKYRAHSVRHFFCTDVSRDGLLAGPATDLYRKLLAHFPGLELIASGGVSSMADIEALAQAGCAGAIVGKAIYEKRITLTDLQKFSSC